MSNPTESSHPARGALPGAGSPAGRWGPARAALLLALVPGTAAAQVTHDVYHVAGQAVDLSVSLDSLGVVTREPITADSVAVLARVALDEPTTIRGVSMGPRGWVVGVAARSRQELRSALARLRAQDAIGWAGMVVRTGRATEPALVTDEFLVRFTPGLSRTVIEAMNRENRVEVLHASRYDADHFLLRVTPESPLDGLAMANHYHDDPRTVYAHPNFWYQDQPSDFFPNDPLFPDQWHLYNTLVSVTPGVPRPDIHAPEAWSLTYGDPKVTIAILEQDGFDAAHPDLTPRLWSNPWITGARPPPQPWTKSGDLHGWNFEGCPGTPGMDPALDPCGTPDLAQGLLGHGTQVAGVAAAEGNNEIGVSGVCPRCSLLLVRMGFISAEVRAAAFDYARVMGADVINASFNTQYNNNTFIDAVTRATTLGRGGRGITVVAGPFDYTFDDDICGASPPLLAGQPNVISVIMSDSQDRRQLGAMGPCLDLMSPGIDIWTTDAGGAIDDLSASYDAVDGNSFAAPVVAGVVGLILSRNPGLTREQVYEILIDTADKVDGTYGPNGHDDRRGYGRVNAYEALKATPLPPPETVTVTAAEYEVGVRLGFTALVGPGGTDHIVAAPGAGPLGEAVLYASWLSAASAMADLQAGLSRATNAASTGPDEHHVSLALMVGLRMSLGAGSLYAGPSGAYHYTRTGSASSSEWGFGAVAGLRRTLGATVALRTEIVYRRWSVASLNEWGLGLGLGVRLH